MTPDEQITYFERAAEHNLLLSHSDSNKRFSVFTPEEVLSSQQWMKGTCLMLELPEQFLGDGLSDNVMIQQRGAYVVATYAKQGNYQDIRQAYIASDVVAKQILSKIQNDRRKANDVGSTDPEKKIKHLDLNRISLSSVGPIFGSFYGWRVGYEINSPINLILNEAQWAEGTETKWTF